MTNEERNVKMSTADKVFADNPAIPEGFWEFYKPLHEKFTPWQKRIIEERRERLSRSLEGDRPQHLPPSEATTGDWKIELPEWCKDQRNQMTGPGDDKNLTVKLINSGAPGVMIDLEDSMANHWENTINGIDNTLKALYGTLEYFDKKRDKVVSVKDSETTIFVRARGLHLSQAGLIEGETTSGSLFDTAMIVFQADADKLRHNLAFYIPKSESADEALWWNELFKEYSKIKGWAPDYIKCMALCEAHSLAYQVEEFIYNLRDHIVGINLGRWDYMASLIHFNLSDPAWVLPDRNTIPSDVEFFQNIRMLIPKICHSRGILAVGGMTALYPSRADAELNARALVALEKDKKNEADCYMDGAWTGHPDQNQIALDQFPYPNQLDRIPDVDRYPDLRPVPEGVGVKTVDGTRAAMRTIIRYRTGYIGGTGANLLDGYMEDLATDRIYRLMIAQRMMHDDKVDILDKVGGVKVSHTKELISQLFDEELAKIQAELPEGADKEAYKEGRDVSERMILAGEFDPV